MAKSTVNEKNLVGLGPEKLSKILLGYAYQYPQLKKNLRYHLVSGDDLVALLAKDIQAKQRGKSKISKKKTAEFVSDIADLQRNLSEVLLKSNPYAAYPLLWEFVILGELLWPRLNSEACKSELSSIFSHVQELILEHTVNLSYEASVVVERYLRYLVCGLHNHEVLPPFALETMKILQQEHSDLLKPLLCARIEKQEAELQGLQDSFKILDEEVSDLSDAQLDELDNIETEIFKITDAIANFKKVYRLLCCWAKDEKAFLATFSKQDLKNPVYLADIAEFYVEIMNKPKVALQRLESYKGRCSASQKRVLALVRAKAYKACKDSAKEQAAYWDAFAAQMHIKDYQSYEATCKSVAKKQAAEKKVNALAMKHKNYKEVFRFLVAANLVKTLAKVVRKKYDYEEAESWGAKAMFRFDDFSESKKILSAAVGLLEEQKQSYLLEISMLYRMMAECALYDYGTSRSALVASQWMQSSEDVLADSKISLLETERFTDFDCHLRRRYFRYASYQDRKVIQGFVW